MIYANTRMHAITTNEPIICSNLDFLFSKDSLPHEKQLWSFFNTIYTNTCFKKLSFSIIASNSKEQPNTCHCNSSNP